MATQEVPPKPNVDAPVPPPGGGLGVSLSALHPEFVVVPSQSWGISDPVAVQTRVTEYLQGPVSSAVNRMLAILADFDFDKAPEFKKSVEEVENTLKKTVTTFFESEAKKLQKHKETVERAKHRQAVVAELSTTEDDYLNDLRMMATIWQLELAKYLSNSDLTCVFGNIPQFVALSSELTEEFRKAKDLPPQEQRIGEIFKKKIPFLRLYTEYALNRDKVSEIVANIRKNHKKIRHLPQIKNLDLPDYLIKPTQRIVKYPLLLKDLIKHTDTDHMDYKHLVTAEEAMRKVLDEINASTRNRQTMVLLSKLQPNLTWVKEAYDLVASKTQLILGEKMKTVVIDKDEKEEQKGNTIYLFDTFLLICGGREGKWTEITTFFLQDCLLKDAESTELPLTVAHKTRHEEIVLYPVDISARQLWVTLITEAIADAPVNAKVLVPKEKEEKAKKKDKDKDKDKEDEEPPETDKRKKKFGTLRGTGDLPKEVKAELTPPQTDSKDKRKSMPLDLQVELSKGFAAKKSESLQVSVPSAQLPPELNLPPPAPLTSDPSMDTHIKPEYENAYAEYGDLGDYEAPLTAPLGPPPDTVAINGPPAIPPPTAFVTPPPVALAHVAPPVILPPFTVAYTSDVMSTNLDDTSAYEPEIVLPAPTESPASVPPEVTEKPVVLPLPQNPPPARASSPAGPVYTAQPHSSAPPTAPPHASPPTVPPPVSPPPTQASHSAPPSAPPTLPPPSTPPPANIQSMPSRVTAPANAPAPRSKVPNQAPPQGQPRPPPNPPAHVSPPTAMPPSSAPPHSSAPPSTVPPPSAPPAVAPPFGTPKPPIRPASNSAPVPPRALPQPGKPSATVPPMKPLIPPRSSSSPESPTVCKNCGAPAPGATTCPTCKKPCNYSAQ